MCGCIARTPAIANLRRSPPESARGLCFNSGVRASCSATDSIRQTRSDRSTPMFSRPKRMSRSTVWPTTCVSASWNTRPMRRFRSLALRVKSVPSMRMLPPIGCTSPLIQRSSRLFPVPFLPERTVNDPSSIEKEISVSTGCFTSKAHASCSSSSILLIGSSFLQLLFGQIGTYPVREHIPQKDHGNQFHQISREEWYETHSESLSPGDVQNELHDRQSDRVEHQRPRYCSHDHPQQLSSGHLSICIAFCLSESDIGTEPCEGCSDQPADQKPSGRSCEVGESSDTTTEYRQSDSSQGQIDGDRCCGKFAAAEHAHQKHKGSLE